MCVTPWNLDFLSKYFYSYNLWGWVLTWFSPSLIGCKKSCTHRYQYMKILGSLHHFLGIEVKHTKAVFLFFIFFIFFIRHRPALQNVFVIDSKPCGSPCNYKSKSLVDTSSTMANPSLHKSITGALQYLTLTEPDLAFAINQLCQHMHRPTETHFVGLKWVLRYLKGTLTFVSHLPKGGLHLTAYSDGNWEGVSSNHCSTSGFCAFPLSPRVQ